MAQTPMERIDTEVGALLSLPDENKYSYEHQLWIDRAREAVAAADVAELDSFVPSVMSKMVIEPIRSTVLFYLRKEGPRASLNWILRRFDSDLGHELTQSFADAVDVDLTGVAACVRPVFSRSMVGFEIADTVSGKRLWWMPDIVVRSDMELLADVDVCDSDKFVAETIVKRRLRSLFDNDDALRTDLRGFPRLFDVRNDARTVRVVTFMNQLGDLSVRFGGMAIRRNISNGDIDIFELEDKSDEIHSPEKHKTTSQRWYGAVYYDMVEAKFGRQTYYTLLGYRGSDGTVKTRVLEPLWFDGKKCRLGAPVFEHERGTYTRRVFRYSADANMMLRWDAKRKSIVFDHLSPISSMYVGEFRFYGPDFSYDGYVRTGKYWQFADDIELRNENY